MKEDTQRSLARKLAAYESHRTAAHWKGLLLHVLAHKLLGREGREKHTLKKRGVKDSGRTTATLLASP